MGISHAMVSLPMSYLFVLEHGGLLFLWSSELRWLELHSRVAVVLGKLSSYLNIAAWLVTEYPCDHRF